MLVEHRGASVLLLADAHERDVISTLPIAEQAYLDWAEANPVEMTVHEDPEPTQPKPGSIQAVWTPDEAGEEAPS